MCAPELFSSVPEASAYRKDNAHYAAKQSQGWIRQAWYAAGSCRKRFEAAKQEAKQYEAYSQYLIL